MFLEKLCEFAVQQMQLPPAMYQFQHIRYVINLDNEGNFLRMDETVDDLHKKPMSMLAPYIKNYRDIPRLLIGGADFVLGIDQANPERAKRRHTAFVDQVQACADKTQEPGVKAVAKFLKRGENPPQSIEKLKANITFKVEYKYPFESADVQKYWALITAVPTSADEELFNCVVCGELCQPCRILPWLIKGVPCGQAGGLTIIAADKPSYWMYGREQSLTCPVCASCGERFSNALNELLRREDTHIIVAPLAYAFWCQKPEGKLETASLLQDARPGQIKALFEGAWQAEKGQRAAKQTNISDYYAATLSASGIRLVIRDWIETTLDRARENLRRYFTLQCIKDRKGELQYFPLRYLINATTNRDAKEQPVAAVGEALLRVALRGGALPLSIMAQVIQRVRASRKVGPNQAALIKMVVLSQHQEVESDYMTALHTQSQDPAYVCGRLLALLDYIQLRALGQVGATVADKYYGAASSSPAVTFSRLLRDVRFHLGSIRQKKGGSSVSLEKELGQIMEQLPVPPGFPVTLTLIEQGRFALGFYHQRTQLFTPRKLKPQRSSQADS